MFRNAETCAWIEDWGEVCSLICVADEALGLILAAGVWIDWIEAILGLGQIFDLGYGQKHNKRMTLKRKETSKKKNKLK